MLPIPTRRTILTVREFETRINPATIESFVTLTSSVYPTAPGQSVTLTAAATYAGGFTGLSAAEGGDITLYDDSNGGAVVGKQSLNPYNNKLSVSTSTLTPGEHKLRAYFTGYTGRDYGSFETNTAAPASATFTQTVLPTGPALTLTPANLPDGVAGAAYSTQLAAFGRPGPYTYAVVEPSYGVNVSPDGLVTFAKARTIDFRVLVTEPSGQTTTYARTIVAQADPATVVKIQPEVLPEGVVGVAYRQALTVTGPPGPYTFTNVFTTYPLPAGLSLSPDGVISGVPTEPTTFVTSHMTLRATAANGNTGQTNLELVVRAAAGTVPPVTPPVTPPKLPPLPVPTPPPGTPVPPPAPTPAAPPTAPPGLVGQSATVVGLTGGTLRVLTPAGTMAAFSAPFAGFTGEVRVAAGANGQVVAATGPGRATQVKQYDPISGAVAFDVPPFEAAFTGGLFVSTGDIFGTGTPDVVVSPDEGGGPRVQIRDGKTGVVRADFFGIDDPGFRGGARTAVADLTGDGVPDLIVAAGVGGGPRVTVFDGAELRAGRQTPIANLFVLEQALRNGVYVTAGDLDGDGKADLIVGGGPGGGPRVLALSGRDLATGSTQPATLANFFAGDPNQRGGVRVAAKDLDGDRLADLVVSPGPGGSGTATAYAGKSVTPGGTPPTLFRYDDPMMGASGAFVG